MSTLVHTHDGVERIVRGGQATAEALSAGKARARGLLARWYERLIQYRQDQVFRQLMIEDPRVYADLQAAAARQEQQG